MLVSRTLSFLAALMLALTAVNAVAETDWDPVGGSGNAAFEDRCPPGQWLVAIQGRAGAWVNRVQIACTAVSGSGPLPRHLSMRTNLWIGPPRGGSGGGVTGGACNGVIRGIWPHMTPGNRQVKYIDLWCKNAFGGPGATGRFNTFTNPGQDVNGGSNQPIQMMCPDQDAAVGLRGRYGADVNAISLICVPFDPEMR